MLLDFIIIINLLVLTAVSGNHSFGELTKEEENIVFGIDDDGNVPDYEIVPVAQIERKNRSRIVKLTSFSQKITLYLEPTDGYLAGVETPVFKAVSDPGNPSGIEFTKIPHAIKRDRQFYQDPDNLAALVIEDKPDGEVVMRGVVDTFGIQPLPSRLYNEYKREKRQVQRNEYNGTDGQADIEQIHHHIVFKIKPVEIYDYEEPMSMPSRSKPSIRPSKHEPSKKNTIPEKIYLQVLVVIEHDLFKIFNRQVNDVIDYTLSYWNGVDLRYRVFKNPRVHINIAGVIISHDSKAIPWISDSMMSLNGYDDPMLSLGTSLRKKSKFLFPETSYDSNKHSMTLTRLKLEYDIVLTLTPKNVCVFDQYCVYDDKYVCDIVPGAIVQACANLGYAYYTGACAYNLTGPEMESVGIIEDRGAFGGIIPTAHEIGHLLGASHNENNEHKCPVDDGYIMSSHLFLTSDSFIWNNCSLYSILKFFEREPRAQCLFNVPPGESESKVGRVLPGELYSRDKQCQRLAIGTRSCVPRDTQVEHSCDRLYCLSHSSNRCEKAPNVAVAEGASCGPQGQGQCFNGKCVGRDAETIDLEIGGIEPKITPTTVEPTGFGKFKWPFKWSLGR